MKQLTPLRAIRKFCLECCNGNSTEVKLCPATGCPLHSRRLGKGGGRLLRIIREKCLDCSGWVKTNVKYCIFNGKYEEKCVLHAYRMGKRPQTGQSSKKRLPTEKQAVARQEFARKRREKADARIKL